jgi:hypothetical protein
MKYIITWILVTTLKTNPHNNLALAYGIHRDTLQVEFYNQEAALRLYKMKTEEYNRQFIDSTHTVILCPKCYSYIDSVKIDSIPPIIFTRDKLTYLPCN